MNEFKREDFEKDIYTIQDVLANLESNLKEGYKTAEARYISARLRDMAGNMANLIFTHDLNVKK